MWLCLRFCESGGLDPVQVRDSRIPGPPVGRIFGAWWSYDHLFSVLQYDFIIFVIVLVDHGFFLTHQASGVKKGLSMSEQFLLASSCFPWLSSVRLIVDFSRFSAVRCDELVQKEISSEDTIAIFWTTYMYVCIYTYMYELYEIIICIYIYIYNKAINCFRGSWCQLHLLLCQHFGERINEPCMFFGTSASSSAFQLPYDDAINRMTHW